MLEAQHIFRLGSLVKKIQCLRLELQCFFAGDEKFLAAIQFGQSLNQGFGAGSRLGEIHKKESESSQFVKHEIIDSQDLSSLQLDESGRAIEGCVQNKGFDSRIRDRCRKSHVCTKAHAPNASAIWIHVGTGCHHSKG